MFYNIGKAGEEMSKKMAEKFGSFRIGELDKHDDNSNIINITVMGNKDDVRDLFADELDKAFGQKPDSKFTQGDFATITIPDRCISEFINTSNIDKFLADCEEYDNTDELVDFYKGLVRDNNELLFYIRVFSELLDRPWEELVKKHTPLSPSEIIMMSEKNMKDFLRAYMENSKDDISEWYGISKTTAYRLKNKIIKELGIVVDKK